MPQRIYFDESGFTGSNLLHPVQQYFSYASVATNDDEARGFVEYLVSKYGLQGGELKGKNLVGSKRGRSAIDEIFNHFDSRLKFSIADKKFALAGKFFDYIFEPCISEVNSIFYRIGFHRFIANILYLEFMARGAGAEEIFAEFEQLMRKKELSKLDSIFSSSVHPKNTPIITKIREFAQLNSNVIHEEISLVKGSSVKRWVLDLTQTSLGTLLSEWGEKYASLTAICDTSEPLQDDQSFFDSMIGNKEKLFIEDSEGEKRPITFNLSGPIEFLDSKKTHGVQIADAVAAATVYVHSGADDDFAKKWRGILPKIACFGCITPELNKIDLSTKGAQLNVVVLLELHRRATQGISLTNGIAEFIRNAYAGLRLRPI